MMFKELNGKTYQLHITMFLHRKFKKKLKKKYWNFLFGGGAVRGVVNFSQIFAFRRGTGTQHQRKGMDGYYELGP